MREIRSFYDSNAVGVSGAEVPTEEPAERAGLTITYVQHDATVYECTATCKAALVSFETEISVHCTEQFCAKRLTCN